jgi:hypothetical protein
LNVSAITAAPSLGGQIKPARSATLCLLATATLGPSACGKGSDSTAEAADNAATLAGTVGGSNVLQVATLNISEEPDVCFQTMGKHLGPDAQVSEINRGNLLHRHRLQKAQYYPLPSLERQMVIVHPIVGPSVDHLMVVAARLGHSI